MHDALLLPALLSSPTTAVVGASADGTIVRWSDGATALLGWTEDEVVGCPLSVIVPQDRRQELALAPKVLAGEHLPPFETARVARDGSVVDLEVHLVPVAGELGVPVGVLALYRDLRRARAAEARLRANEARLSALLRHAADVVVVHDPDGRVLYVSPAVTARFGFEPQQLLWQRLDEHGHPDDAAAASAAWESVAGRPGASATYECRVRHADGSWRWTEQIVTNLLDDPDVGGVVVNVRDVTERRQAQLDLERLALQDGLTGLANRALLLDRIRQALSWERRSGTLTGLVLLDVDGMAEVNEAVGHAGGDAVLRSLAARLREAVRETDSVARTGGDELAVLVEDVASVEELRARATNLVDLLSGPVTVDGVTVEVSLHVASVMSPAADEGALLAAAERALAGPRPVARVVVERAAVVADALDSRDVAELRRAIEDGQLRLHYQPVLRLECGEVAGAEALVRWQHPERGLLPPSEFVPLAESSGLVVDLGAWALREACRTAATWHAAGRSIGVGLNLSPRQMVGHDVVDLVREVLDETGVRADCVVLEVTESTLMDDAGAPDVLHALRDLGVRLALDDFGTGYSSLTYLKRFPIDAIKIDRSFVAGLGKDPDDEAIVASVVSLARSVGKLVVAEGVETSGQLAVLRDLGVEQGQGYLWSPALPAAELDAWLRGRGRPAAAPAPGRPKAAPAEVAAPPTDDEVRMLQLHREGASLHTIAAALNAEGRRTPAGPRWTPTTVARVVASLSRRV